MLEGLGVARAVCVLPKVGEQEQQEQEEQEQEQEQDQEEQVNIQVPEWWLINVASIRCGAVLLPGTTQLTERDIEGRLLSSKADTIICDPATAAKVGSMEGC